MVPGINHISDKLLSLDSVVRQRVELIFFFFFLNLSLLSLATAIRYVL